VSIQCARSDHARRGERETRHCIHRRASWRKLRATAQTRPEAGALRRRRRPEESAVVAKRDA